MSGQIKVSAYGNNGPLTETFHYTINGKKIHETLDIDLNSATYGKTLTVKTREGGKLIEVSPNSELGLAIVHDANSNRQTSFINEMSYISGKAEGAGYGKVHELALKNSGMWALANGDKPFNDIELPAVEYVIEPGEVEEEQKDDETTSEAVPRRSEEKKFVGVMQYPASAHYSSRGRPAQDHMKIDMFQYKAPQADFLGGYFEDKVPDATTNKTDENTGVGEQEKNMFVDTVND